MTVSKHASVIHIVVPPRINLRSPANRSNYGTDSVKWMREIWGHVPFAPIWKNCCLLDLWTSMKQFGVTAFGVSRRGKFDAQAYESPMCVPKFDELRTPNNRHWAKLQYFDEMTRNAIIIAHCCHWIAEAIASFVKQWSINSKQTKS